MSAFIDAWWEWALRGVVLSSLLLGIAWLLHAALGRRLSARAAHALAWLPLIPLLLPRWTTWEGPAIQDRTWQSLATRAGFATPNANTSFAPAGATVSDTPAHISQEAAATHTEIAPELLTRRGEELSAASWWFALWGLGVAWASFGLLRNLRRTDAVVRAARPLSSQQVRALNRLVPASRGVRLLHSDQLASPAAWGCWDRRVVLPTGLLDQLESTELAWILRHELAHHARYDLIWSFLQRLVQIVWWFHPALWWWNQRIELTRECACDERAAQSLGRDRRPAANALLAVAVAERPHRTPHVALALHSSTDPVRTMQTRLTRLLQPRSSRLAGFATTTLCGLLAGATLLLSQSAWSLAPQEPVEVEPPVEIEEVVEEPIEIEEIFEEEEPNRIVDQVWEEEPPAPNGFRFGEAPVGFRAQAWLLNQQSQDGSWATGTEVDDASGEYTVVGNTALVLLALRQRHPALPEPRWAAAIGRGMNYLEARFDDESGSFASAGTNFRAMHDHLMATYVAVEMKEHARGSDWDRIRQRAVATIQKARNPYMGWRFSFQPDGDNDSFTTALALRTLAAYAANTNQEVDRSDRDGALHFLQSVTDPNSGRVGYQKKGGDDPRFVSKVDDYPTKYTELCTAVASLARHDAQVDLFDDELALRSLTLIAAKPPVWNMTNGSVDYYYWMYGAQAMQLVGGRIADRWHAMLRQALIEHQNTNGSWPAVDAWATAGADIHATACALVAWQASQPQPAGGR